MKATIIKIVAAIVALSAASYGIIVLYMQHKGVDLSIHGHIAAALAVFFTYGVGAGLMALLFFSNKHGHDEQVHNVLETDTSAETTDGDK